MGALAPHKAPVVAPSETPRSQGDRSHPGPSRRAGRGGRGFGAADRGTTRRRRAGQGEEVGEGRPDQLHTCKRQAPVRPTWTQRASWSCGASRCGGPRRRRGGAWRSGPGRPLRSCWTGWGEGRARPDRAGRTHRSSRAPGFGRPAGPGRNRRCAGYPRHSGRPGPRWGRRCPGHTGYARCPGPRRPAGPHRPRWRDRPPGPHRARGPRRTPGANRSHRPRRSRGARRPGRPARLDRLSRPGWRAGGARTSGSRRSGG
jgi:hypothetical protein